jgi:soluble lytic murein transglycosylase-like protein
MEKRLYSFFKKHEVRRPDYYAQLISCYPMPDRNKLVLAAILIPESRGRANSINKESGATGAWQVMPFWKKKLNVKGSLLDPIVNLHAASKVYNIHLKEARYNEYQAIADYSGRTKGYADKVLRLVKTI